MVVDSCAACACRRDETRRSTHRLETTMEYKRIGGVPRAKERVSHTFSEHHDLSPMFLVPSSWYKTLPKSLWGTMRKSWIQRKFRKHIRFFYLTGIDDL